MTEHILFEGTGAEGWRWTHMLRGPEAEAAMYADPDIPDAAAGALSGMESQAWAADQYSDRQGSRSRAMLASWYLRP